MLTQIQRDAMKRAQAGDFSLADAIEVLHPDRRYFNGERLLGGISQGGRLQYFAYGNNPVCDECKDGKVECEECDDGDATCASCGHVGPCKECNGLGKVDCDNCGGSGIVDAGLPRDEGDWAYVVSLNGDVIFNGAVNAFSDTPPLEITLTEARAQKIVDAYNAEGDATTAPVQSSLAVAEQAVAA